MKTNEFPEFIQQLPQAAVPIEEIRGWLLNSNDGQVLFLKVDKNTVVPKHKHGDQWGIVVNGQMDLTIGDKTETYCPGNSYFIPAGTMHGATLYKDFLALDYFADKNRYNSK